MKKRYLMALSCALVTNAACAQQKQVGYVVKGKIEGLSNASLYYMAGAGDDIKSKQVKTDSEGVFEFKDTANTEGPRECLLIDGTQGTFFKGGVMAGVRSRFFAANGDVIEINGKKEEFELSKSSGNKSNAQLMEYMAQIRDVQLQLRAISGNYQKLMRAKEPEDGANMIRNENEEKLLQQEKARISSAFISKHPHYLVSAYILSDISVGLQLDDLKDLYAKLDSKVKELAVGKAIEEQIIGKKYEGSAREGSQAPDFAKTDRNGNSIRLSDYKGKYVLLDFWGSWCGPCRQSHPHLKELSGKYSADGLVVIGIAEERTTNKTAWLKAIQVDGLPWTQILNDEGKDKVDVVSMYDVNSFPTKILIDKEGKIILRISGSGLTAGTAPEDAEPGSASPASAASASASSSSASAGSSSTVSSSSGKSSRRQSTPEESLDSKLREIFKR